MNKFTIDSSFLENNANNYDVFLNILMVFAQDNPFYICVDDKNFAIETYYALGERYEIILSWLNSMSYTNFKFFHKVVSCDIDETTDSQSLFLRIASKVNPAKQLVVANKQFYSQQWEDLIRENSINLLDVDQLRYYLNTRVMMVSYGDHSPNVFGNNNIFK